MNEKEIIAGNKLIAEFMGIEKIVKTDGITFVDNNTKMVYELKYHLSWEWLMPVIKKIDGLNMHRVYPNMERFWQTLTEIDNEKMFGECIEFINWYNETTGN